MIDPEWKIAKGRSAGWEDDRQPPGPMYMDRHHTGSKYRLSVGAGQEPPLFSFAHHLQAVVRPAAPSSAPGRYGEEDGSAPQGQDGRCGSLGYRQWGSGKGIHSNIFAGNGPGGARFETRTGGRPRNGSRCLPTRCVCPPSPRDGYVPEWKPPTRVF